MSLAPPRVPYVRARNLIGMPVMEERHAKRIGQVRDVLIDEGQRPSALLLAPRRWWWPAIVLPVGSIRRLGPEAVVIASGEDTVRVKSLRHCIGTVQGKRKMIGTAVWTQGGETLGTVCDVYFGVQLATPILGFELTEGWLNDLRDGRRWLPAPANWSVGDVILVPEDDAEYDSI